MKAENWQIATDSKIKENKKMFKNNFSRYGFTSDLKGEITKKIDATNQLLGIIYNDQEAIDLIIIWDSNTGEALDFWDVADGNKFKLEQYNLTPLKKEWYLNTTEFDDYIGKIIINYRGDIRRIQNIDKYKVATKEQNMYHDILKAEDWQIATNE